MLRFIKYYTSNLLKTFFLTLFFLIFLLAIYEIFYRLYDFLKFKPPITTILKYLSHCLPDWTFWSIPISLLLSLITYNGKLIKSNEIIAIKSLGINLNYLIAQALLVGILGFVVKLISVHEFLPKYKNLSIEIYEHEIKKKPQQMTHILKNVALELPNGYIIIAKSFDIKNNEFTDVILEKCQNSILVKQILAKSLKLENEAWFLHNFIERTFDKTTTHQVKKIKEKFDCSIDTSVIFSESKEIFELTTGDLKSRMRHLNKRSYLYNRLSTNYYFRIFYPLLSPFLSLVGTYIPLQHSNIGYTHTRGLGIGIALVILLYFVISLAYHISGSGILHPMVIFLILYLSFFTIGIYLITKIRR